MARYRVLQKSFINNQSYDIGAEVEWDGIPAANLEPIDAEGKKQASAAEKAGQPLTVPEDWNPAPSADAGA
ncbi:hypothetical protein UFOVP152_13 [uncultured Caudovirales phage]|uniref:Uncharacterized protein n=1 Tax=uncultured Caudovirales phage TaxID=2100421 RepID=A0A6J7W815_9CAUD|nr:hypothetical protein UFOVP152_13 [uncultured Caudovirales phage]